MKLSINDLEAIDNCLVDSQLKIFNERKERNLANWGNEKLEQLDSLQNRIEYEIEFRKNLKA